MAGVWGWMKGFPDANLRALGVTVGTPVFILYSFFFIIFLNGRGNPSPYERVVDAPRPLKLFQRLVGGDRGGWGVLGVAELEGWVTTHIRREEGVPRRELESVGGSRSDTDFYSLFFILYYFFEREGKPFPYERVVDVPPPS